MLTTKSLPTAESLASTKSLVIDKSLINENFSNMTEKSSWKIISD